MGRDKASLRHSDNGTFLDHAIERLTPICDEVCLAGISETNSDCVCLSDPTPFRGPASGVASALQHASNNRFDGVLVTPVDMPILATRDLCQICDRWLQDPRQMVVALSGASDRVEPLVAIYPTRVGAEIEAISSGNDRSLLRWIASQPYLGVRLPPHSCRNVNTPEDLERGEVSL